MSRLLFLAFHDALLFEARKPKQLAVHGFSNSDILISGKRVKEQRWVARDGWPNEAITKRRTGRCKGETLHGITSRTRRILCAKRQTIMHLKRRETHKVHLKMPPN